MKISHETNDLRIINYEKLISPKELYYQLPLKDSQKQFIKNSRNEIVNILENKSNKLLVIVGPCSIHDTDAALEYAKKLKNLSDNLNDHLFIVMRTYFEKPRTTVGWKGLINDPYLNNSFKINEGLFKARKLLSDITDIGLPIGCELLDTISPQYFSDFISWGAIGARTTECQLHRELISGTSFPCGFKNGTDGNIDIALDAIISSKNKHCFLGIDNEGKASIVKTSGNKDCHIILRGGKNKTNYDDESIKNTYNKMISRNLNPKIMIDCSHGNSQKNYKNQKKVIYSIKDQIKNKFIFGIMLESNLVEGNQKISNNLIYGQSITDECIGWDETSELLFLLNN
jgi:3-deoxy-7-phosphoheptulonate synthase